LFTTETNADLEIKLFWKAKTKMPMSKVVIYFLDNKVNKCKTMRYQYKDDIINRLHRWAAANPHHHLPHSRNIKQLVTIDKKFTFIPLNKEIVNK
jgi:hypothetical protein